MVGIVVVSHSAMLADGVVALAREMGGAELAIEAAGGVEDADPDQVILGTDAERVRAAVERAMSPDGVLVLMDLGSALMSAEFAVELLGDTPGPVRLSAAPLVEGAVAAAAAAAGGAPLDEVAAEARGALEMKAAQVTDDDGVGERSAPTPSVGERSTSPVGDGEPLPQAVELTVDNAIGLHARPAARFVETVRRFDAEVRVTKVGSGRDPVPAQSLTNLVALGARRGDTLQVSAGGPAASEVLAALRELAATGFGDGIDGGAGPGAAATTPAVTSGPPVAVAVPVAGDVLTAIGAAAGIVDGPAHLLCGPGGPPPERTPADPATETAALARGLAAARTAITEDRTTVAGRAGEAEAEIFDAHLTLLDDDALLAPARAAIDAGATAEHAMYAAAAQIADVYRGLDDPLLRERATDVVDVGRRVVAAIAGGSAGEAGASGIVVADELTPADTARLDPARVLGIATARGSTTAHAAILARAMGLPAVLGLGPAILEVSDGTTLLLDGASGTVTVEPTVEVLEAARERGARDDARRTAARDQAKEPAVTTDGAHIDVFANLGSVADAERAVSGGAEGVGLLRTEFLFGGRDSLPDEDEQVTALTEIARTLDGRDLIVRTLDAGADKPLAALPMPPEQNPFLGVRGIRLGLARPDVLATQLRAILRVADAHPLKVMLPMVATLQEITATRALLDQARHDTGVDAPLPLGIMVEVPAAAVTAARLAAHVDFFSLGTNDLAQYTMAAERGDARLAGLLAGPHPALLALIAATVRGAGAHDRWVGVCGELAGDPAAAVLLAGLGVTELSMAPGLVAEVKAALRSVSLADARAAARAALEVDDAPAARALAERLF